MDEMENIFDSLVNGQGRQMVEQIDAENLYDFWDDFHNYLLGLYGFNESTHKYFSQAVITYHRIKYG